VRIKQSENQAERERESDEESENFIINQNFRNTNQSPFIPLRYQPSKNKFLSKKSRREKVWTQALTEPQRKIGRQRREQLHSKQGRTTKRPKCLRTPESYQINQFQA